MQKYGYIILDLEGNWFWDDHCEVFYDWTQAWDRAEEACNNIGALDLPFQIVEVKLSRNSMVEMLWRSFWECMAENKARRKYEKSIAEARAIT